MIDFDEAIGSRIQIILHYPALGPGYRAKIWEKHMRDGRIPPDWNLEEKCRQLGKRYELNGREIRNLVQVTMSICRQRNQSLSEDMIEVIYDLRYRDKGIFADS